MIKLLTLYCIFSIALTPVNGKLDLTYQGETQRVEASFEFECENYHYEARTLPYWLNSVADMRVFFFDDFLVWYYEDRPGRHDPRWELTIKHQETSTSVTAPLKDRDWLPLPIQNGKNTYTFLGKVGTVTFEIPEVMIVWRDDL